MAAIRSFTSSPTMKQSPPTETEIRGWLTRHQLRVTEGRVSTVQILRAESAPISLTDLHLKLQPLDFATVFRFVKMLENKRLLVRHNWDDGTIRYALHSDQAHECHHHYIICRSCRRAEELDHCTVEQMERDLVRNKGYRDLSHSLQFFGICPDCQSSQPPKTRSSARPRKP